ncbi:hypothetical protein FRC08_017793 [Ceratobasidium sp. 394]|nr:hypothetical protein FRC08_017793 [Ceratobasidium sp. 394]
MADPDAHSDQAGNAESDGEPENDGQHYYLNALTGPYASLTISGRPPLFILKDAWDDKPRPRGRTHEQYHQILDTRTRLQMLISSMGELTRGSHGMVEWTDHSVHDGDKEGDNDEDESSSSESCASQGLRNQQLEGQIALLHADIAGWPADDNEDEEILSIWSSEGEEKETEEPSMRIYYPLFRTLEHRGDKTRRLLKDIANCHDTHEYADLRELAAQMLAEIERADRTPFVGDR